MDTSFIFDFAEVSFIDGTGYTVLSNTLQWLISHGTEITFRNWDNANKPAIAYLDDCGFFLEYVEIPIRQNRQCRSTTIPCTPIKHANAHGWLERKLSPWIGHVLGVSHGQLASVRTCVKEIFNNIDDHSTQDTGFVHLQHYPNIHSVKITVSDFGTGIPNTIRAQFGDMTDREAILHASKEGITAKSRPNNMGAGLAYLIDTVTANQGTVAIHSLSGILNCFRDKDGMAARKAATGNGMYPGTLIDINLDTRLFVGDEEERVDLEW